MASKQRLTVASIWGFEDAGVQDIQNAFKYAHPRISPGKFAVKLTFSRESNPAVDYICEYSKADDIWVVKGTLDDARTAAFVHLIEKAIDDEREKDLLDAPKIRQLEISTVHEVEEANSIPAELTVVREGQLLDGDSDEEVVVNSISRVTKAWSSSFGGLGCFVQSGDYNHILARVADATGTEIVVDERSRNLRVSGKNASDVEDALVRLTRIEQPLSLASNPRIGNMAIAYPVSDNERFRIQNYGIMNPIALPRVLVDHRSPSLIDLPMAFTTVLVEFDDDTQLFVLTRNLREPPRVGTEPGISRLWTNFSFREIGAKENFMDMDTVVEKAAAQNNQSLVSVAAIHPYLTAEKANEVQKWVTDGVRPEPTSNMAAEAEAVAVAAQPVPPPVAQLPTITPVKRHPGIKIRRPKYLAAEATATQTDTALDQSQAPASNTAGQRMESNTKKQAQLDSHENATDDQPDALSKVPVSSDPVKLSNDKSIIDETAGKVSKESSPRKRWKMTYNPDPPKAAKEGVASTSTSQALEKDMTLLGDVSSSQPPRVPSTENKFRLPPGFDMESYNRKRTTTKSVKQGRVQGAGKAAGGAGYRMPMRSTPKKRDAFVDLLEPVAPVKSHAHLALSFDQPTLIPEKIYVLSDSQDASVSHGERDKTSVEDETSEGKGLDAPPSAVVSFDSSHRSEPSDPGEFERQRKRLAMLKKQLDVQRQEMAREEATSLHRTGISKYNTLIKERLAQLERTLDPTEKQAVDETSSREYRRTMLHRMGKPTSQAKGKGVAKAQKQATLEDAWGIPSKSASSSQKQKVDTFKAEVEVRTTTQTGNAGANQSGAAEQDPENDPVSEYVNSCIKSVFEYLKPTIEAAEYFPGSLTLEVQLGLVLIPLLPKTHLDGLITLNDWVKIFQPRNGLCAPSTMFLNRLTSSGTDVDFIIDIKTSKAEGRARLFDQDFTDYSVTYEYHFRTRSDQLLIVVIDEDGKFTMQKSPSTLAQFNMHFPKHTWDASVVLSGTTANTPGSDEETVMAVKCLVENMWLQSNKRCAKIFTRLPKRSGLVIEKVLVKRWTSHRYLGSHHSKTSTHHQRGVPNASAPVAVERSSHTASNVGETSLEPDFKDRSPAINDGTGESLFLRITEIQDLFIGISNSDTQIIRARSAPPMEMAKASRLWYEVSLVSPAIDTVLKANYSDAEIGERSEDWCSVDLLGADAGLVAGAGAPGKEQQKTPPTLSTIATKIGNAGLGELLRAAKMVVEKIDAVGYFNRGPIPAQSAMHTAQQGVVATTGTAVAVGGLGGGGGLVKSNQEQAVVASSLGGVVRPAAALPPRSFGFHDIASVRAVDESASQIGNHGAPKASVLTVTQEEEAELAYW